MHSSRLPTKLGKEPLVEAIFEIRFEEPSSGSEILPGFLYSRLEGEKEIQRLPPAELPKPIRDTSPELRYSPIVRIERDKYIITLGDRVLTLSCKLPYVGWKDGFRQEISATLRLISELNLIKTVERYSIKYVNIIPAETVQEQLSKLNITIEIGNGQVSPSSLVLKMESVRDSVIYLLSFVAGATAQLSDGRTLTGMVIDIDSIINVDREDFHTWLRNAESAIDTLRIKNKEVFFSLLTTEALTEMEPDYG